jgi:hypothetical protein
VILACVRNWFFFYRNSSMAYGLRLKLRSELERGLIIDERFIKIWKVIDGTG